MIQLLSNKEFAQIHTDFYSCICAPTHFVQTHNLGVGKCCVENCSCLEFKQQELVLNIGIFISELEEQEEYANNLQSLFSERRTLFPGFR